MEDMINTKELCELFGITENTAYNWRKNQGLPYIQITKKTIKYDKKKVLEWFNARSKEGGK